MNIIFFAAVVIFGLIAWFLFERRTNSNNSADHANSLEDLAFSYQSKGEYAQAESLYREAIKNYAKALGNEHPRYATSLNNLGTLYKLMGRYAEAELFMKEGTNIFAKVLGRENYFYATSMMNLGSLYESMGRYAEAEYLLRESQEIYTKIIGTDNPNYIAALNGLALVYEAMGRYAEAEPLYQESLEIGSRVLGTAHPTYATILNNLAALYRLMGRYTEAEPLYLQAQAINATALGTEHREYATSLNNLAILYESMGRYAEAEPLYHKSLKIQAKVIGNEHPNYAASLISLANLYRLMGKYAKAEPLYLQCLKIQAKVLGTEHPSSSQSLNSLATLYESMGRYNQAEPLFIQALDINAKILGTDHPDYVPPLNNLALLYTLMGRYDQAESLYLQAIEIRGKTLGTDHPHYALSLGTLAELYMFMGRYTESKSLYLQALEIVAKVLGTDHPNYATNLNNLGWLYYLMGWYDEAEPLYIQALEIHSKAVGTAHLDSAPILSNLALLYKSTGRYTEVEPLYQKALKITAKSLGNTHPDYATFLFNLAQLYHSMRMETEAESLYHQALEIRAKVLGIEHPDYAISLEGLAILYKSMGRYAEAEPLLREGKEIFAKILGIEHPNYAISLMSLALLYAANDCSQEALVLMQESADIDLKTISQIFSISTDNQRLTYLQQNYDNLESFLSLVSQHFLNSPEAIQSAYNLVLRRKAIATETTILQKIALLSEQYSHLAPKLEQWRQVRQQLAKRCFDIPTPEQSAYYQSEIDSLRQQAQTLERELNIPELNLQKELQNANHSTIALELPEGTTLVEFVRFNVPNFQAISANGDSHWFPPRYVAFILPAKEPERLKMVDLGEAEPIDLLVRDFRVSTEGGRGFDLDEIVEEDEIDPKIELRSLVFDKLKPHLSKDLFICPDGELNCLPFEVLPTDEGRYLMDEYNFNFLSVGRDILRFKSQIPATVTKPLVIANPDYNLTAKGSASPPVVGERTILYQKLASSRGGQVFSPLPGTEIEGEKIAKLLGVKAVMQAQALKSLVSQTKSCPYILHIATHGYFLENIQPQQEERIRQNFLLLNLSASERFQLGSSQNPLLRSGLAFAGANTMLNGKALPEAAEDGLLTALDVQSLNLGGTELVVTSACETALGAVFNGETVVGLRRSFIQAGAKTVVMSLWRVDDFATAILMERFYYYLLQSRLSKAEALKQAKYDVRNMTIAQMRSQWLTESAIEWAQTHSQAIADHLRQLSQKSDSERPYEHPYYWAAFICLGNPAQYASVKL
ncbi:tetratricopeptide repeat protein [Pelatocladus sp. BLCC-F211]|uniref:CHAT domain-containing tetratricopeptide repeat protein n=1 Tax=Pelatocladus sp. BLCC-F211 TaxID=3342752 RepID=UPI0035B918BD